MATYKEIHGVKVQYRDSDATAIEGDVWYNASTGKLKMYSSVGAWASGGNMNDARPYAFGSGGVQGAAISFGGSTANDTGNENYDGTSWTENAAMNNGYGYSTGTGTQTDAIAIAGFTTPPHSAKTTTEEWDGSSWTAGGNISTGRYNVHNQAYGPGSAAGFVGGKNPSFAIQALQEHYDGSSWTEVGDVPAPAWTGSSAGIQTANILIGGQISGSNSAESFTWDGSSWTDIGVYNTARYTHAASGVYDDAILVGGFAPGDVYAANTESWDGSSWTELADLSTARSSLGASKTETGITSAIVFGGEVSPYKSTEEWNVAASVQTVAFD